MKPRMPAVLLSLLIGGSVAWAQPPTSVGGQFQVNTYTTSYQEHPSVGVADNGDFVVVWQSFGSSGTDTSDVSIQGQLFNANGTAEGHELQINTYTTSRQGRPSIALVTDGSFVVVWEGAGIRGQRFDAAGIAVGSEFQINTDTTSGGTPSVALNSDGDFVVVWEAFGSSGTDDSFFSIQGRRFDATGAALGDQFQINTYTKSGQLSPSVALHADGSFAVVWDSSGSSGTDISITSIQGQRFDAAGIAAGGEFQINSYTTGDQDSPSLALDTDGNFVVVWRSSGSNGTDTSGFSVQGRWFDATGTAMGGEFQINTYTTGYQISPSVGVDADGNFVVVWQSYGSNSSDSSMASIQGQRLHKTGMRVGDEFQVNTYTTSYQESASVALNGGGDFVVVWASDGSSGTDDSSYSVQSQRYRFGLVFADGFESGDTTDWSSEQPTP